MRFLVVAGVFVIASSCGGDDGGGGSSLPSVTLTPIATIDQLRGANVPYRVRTPAVWQEPTGRYALLDGDGNSHILDIETGEVRGMCPLYMNNGAGLPLVEGTGLNQIPRDFSTALFQVTGDTYEGLHERGILRCTLGADADTEGTHLEVLSYAPASPIPGGIRSADSYTDGVSIWYLDGTSEPVDFDFSGYTDIAKSIKRDRSGFWMAKQDNDSSEIVFFSVDLEGSVTELSRHTPGAGNPNVQLNEPLGTFNGPAGCMNVDLANGWTFENVHGCGEFFINDGQVLMGPGPFNNATDKSYLSYIPVDGGPLVEHVRDFAFPTPDGHVISVEAELKDVYVWASPADTFTNQRPDDATRLSVPCTECISLIEHTVNNVRYDNGGCALNVDMRWSTENSTTSGATNTLVFPCNDPSAGREYELLHPFGSVAGGGFAPIFGARRPIVYHAEGVTFEDEVYTTASGYHVDGEGQLTPLWNADQVLGTAQLTGYRYSGALGFGYEGEVYRIESPY